LLNRIRAVLSPIIDKLGSSFSKTGITPTGWSLIGLLFAVLSGFAYSVNWEGSVLGGLFLLISGFFDIVDGSVARITKSVSQQGAFIDSNFDRITEIMVYGGIIIGEIVEPVIVLGALSISMLVSYARAKGDSFNVELSAIGIGERAERIIILAIASILSYTFYGVILVLFLATITYVHRFIYIVRNLQ
jgi:archaetidylinositol phosphate synthase